MLEAEELVAEAGVAEFEELLTELVEDSVRCGAMDFLAGAHEATIIKIKSTLSDFYVCLRSDLATFVYCPSMTP